MMQVNQLSDQTNPIEIKIITSHGGDEKAFTATNHY